MLLSQQTAQYSLSNLNRYNFNPAYAGLDYSLSSTGVSRNQWNGISRRPSTQSLNAHMPLYIANGGVGFKLENDILGSRRNLNFALSYNYVMTNDWGILSIGIAAGINQFTLDGTELRTRDGNYEGNVIEHQDPLLPNTKESDLKPRFEVGAYAILGDFEAGISVVNIGAGSFNIPGQDGILKVPQDPVIHLSSEYTLAMNPDWDFIPSIFISSDINETQLSGLLRFVYGSRISFGAGWRGYSQNSFDAAIGTVGYKINEHFDLHYAYDIGLSDLTTRSNGSHELILKYNLNKKIGAGTLPRIIYNPRFL